METLNKKFEEHAKQDRDDFDEIKHEIKSIKENHLAHIQDSMNELSTNVRLIANDMSWIKELRSRNGNGKTSEDKAQNTSIEWNTWLLRGLISFGIGAFGTIITILISNVLKE